MSVNPYQKYKKTSVESASREKLLLMLYEAAIKYVKKAQLAIKANDIASKGENIGYAYDIVMELNNTLDHKVGGEIAVNLEQLYMFVTDQLVQANIKSSMEHLNNALSVLETLLKGWQEAISSLKQKETKKSS